MKRKFTALLVFLALALAVPFAAFADMGPKPSVEVQTVGLTQSCWVTLLAEQTVIGPWNLPGSEMPDWFDPGEQPAWEAFSAFEDEDGYHFLQWQAQVSDEASAAWNYMAPQRFKILLWFPDTGAYALSEPLERYAFAAVYRLDLTGLDLSGADGTLTIPVYRNYDYLGEALGLAARLVLTLAVELLIALPFGYLKRRYLKVLLLTNLATQLALNLALNITAYHSGWLAMWLLYPLLELAVFGVEAVVFRLTLKKPENKGTPVLYAFVANTVSYVFGLWLGNVLPHLF